MLTLSSAIVPPLMVPLTGVFFKDSPEAAPRILLLLEGHSCMRGTCRGEAEKSNGSGRFGKSREYFSAIDRLSLSAVEKNSSYKRMHGEKSRKIVGNDTGRFDT